MLAFICNLNSSLTFPTLKHLCPWWHSTWQTKQLTTLHSKQYILIGSFSWWLQKLWIEFRVSCSIASLSPKLINWCCFRTFALLCALQQPSQSRCLHSIQKRTAVGGSSTESSKHASHKTFVSTLDKCCMFTRLSMKKFFWIPSIPFSGILNSSRHRGHAMISPGCLSCPVFSRHLKQKVWMQGSILGSEYSSMQILHSSMSCRSCVDTFAIL